MLALLVWSTTWEQHHMIGWLLIRNWGAAGRPVKGRRGGKEGDKSVQQGAPLVHDEQPHCSNSEQAAATVKARRQSPSTCDRTTTLHYKHSLLGDRRIPGTTPIHTHTRARGLLLTQQWHTYSLLHQAGPLKAANTIATISVVPTCHTRDCVFKLRHVTVTEPCYGSWWRQVVLTVHVSTPVTLAMQKTETCRGFSHKRLNKYGIYFLRQIFLKSLTYFYFVKEWPAWLINSGLTATKVNLFI